MQQIKRSTLFAFMVWMQKGKHKLSEKKNAFIMKKGDNIAIVKFKEGDEYLEANDYALNRYDLFLSHYLNGGKEFIAMLKIEGSIEAMRNKRNYQLENLR